jgi:hypothetical protein
MRERRKTFEAVYGFFLKKVAMSRAKANLERARGGLTFNGDVAGNVMAFRTSDGVTLHTASVFIRRATSSC